MPFIPIKVAAELAQARIEALARSAGDQFEMISERTEETERGWVFFYNSADFVRTRDPASALAGNGPIFVTKEGHLYELPSSIPWRDAVSRL